MKKIGFTINKGGVGKTTSICAIGQILALGGYKVLIADYDPQANSSAVFSVIEDLEGCDYSELFTETVTIENLKSYIVKTSVPNLDILPSSTQLFGMNDIIYEAQKDNPAAGLNLKKNLDLLEKTYDYILMDTTPAFDHVCESVIAAADMLLTPAQTDSFSFKGILRLMQLMEAINEAYNLEIKYGGVFFTRVKSRTNLFKGLKKDYGDKFGEYFIPVSIRDCNKVIEANTNLIPLYQYEPKCTASTDYVELVGALGLMDKRHYNILKNNLNL